MGKRCTLRVEYDHDTECPSDWGRWKLVSFSKRHASFSGPAAYIAGLNQFGEPIPANIGIRRRLQAGTAFVLSYFEHGQCVWSLMGEGPQCRWDGVPVAGILLWDGGTPPPAEHREADARQFLRTYTAWANGECYWYALEDDQGETIDSCGGFFGLEDALRIARAALPVGHEITDVAGLLTPSDLAHAAG